MAGPASLVALVVALATPPPFTVDLPTPSPLPEIGRTRSTSRACTAYRELVMPSLSAVLRADARFGQARDHLSAYGERLDDTFHEGGALSRALDLIDRDGLAMLQETLVLNRALGDRRLADPSDPQLREERTALQQLYDAESDRAWLLVNFSRSAKFRQLRLVGSKDPFTAVGPNAGDAGPDQGATPAPDPKPTADNGFPQLSGIGQADKRALAGWSTELGETVRSAELGVAPALVSLSRGCR